MSEPTERKRNRHLVWLAAVLLGLGLVAVYVTTDVSTALTQADRDTATRILQETDHGALVGQTSPADFDKQIDIILGVQDAVLKTAPDNTGIPFDQSREPADLYKARAGLCFDRSRAIEKILSHLGFEVRHAAVYSTKDTGSRIAALTTKGTPSHAVTEVKTDRGWVVVDSNRRWISLTDDGKPIDLEGLQAMDVAAQSWDPRVETRAGRIFRGPFTYVIGLYSRHGRFYAPYLPVPDIDWQQIPGNFID